MRQWIILPLVLLLAACGGADEQADAPLNFDATYGQDQDFSFNYPDTWIAVPNANGTIDIASNQDTLDTRNNTDGQGELPPGNIVMTMDIITLESLGMPADTGPEALLQLLAPDLVAGEGDAIYGDVTALALGGHSAARMDGASSTSDLSLLIVDVGNGAFAIIAVSAPLGEMGSFNDALEGIISSMTYTTP